MSAIAIRAQFKKPEGWMGWLIGHLMAVKNRERSEWVISLLAPQPRDRVLEVGFGSGADIVRVSRLAGFVAGVDHSEAMVRMASRRNSRGIGDGRVELRLASAGKLPYPDGRFDKIYSINVAQFLPNLADCFREYGRVLAPGGLAAVAVQPRSKGATEETATAVGEKMRDAMAAAGFEQVRLERKPMRPVSTVCVLGRRPV